MSRPRPQDTGEYETSRISLNIRGELLQAGLFRTSFSILRRRKAQHDCNKEDQPQDRSQDDREDRAEDAQGRGAQGAVKLVRQRSNGAFQHLPYSAKGTDLRTQAETVTARAKKGETSARSLRT